MKKMVYAFIFMSVCGLSFMGCRKASALESTNQENMAESYPDWSETTHGNGTEPNYEMVFPQNQVIRLDIKISEEDWSTMQSDLSSLMNTGGFPGQEISTENPVWVKCSVFFNGKEWYHVGIRYKGNSSLMSAYRSGIKKLSFKLDFDQFEDDYPLLRDQRFYGFRQLNLNNNFEDQSLLREKIGADLFRQFGLAASQTTFCILYLDHGDGSTYYGVYTLVEEVDDTVIKSQFSADGGNLYKPEGQAATFAWGSFNEQEMFKKSNELTSDYSDVKNLYEWLNSDARMNSIDLWKSRLDSLFDVKTFLKWLAANTAIQNWDTYGRMAHNYYLYHDPQTDKLTWIPWDNNEAFQLGKMGGALSLSLDEVTEDWPLIRYLLDVSEYQEAYTEFLNQFVTDIFNPQRMEAVYDGYSELVKEYAYAEQTGYTFLRSPADFDNAIALLKTHVQDRMQAVLDYVQQH